MPLILRFWSFCGILRLQEQGDIEKWETGDLGKWLFYTAVAGTPPFMRRKL